MNVLLGEIFVVASLLSQYRVDASFVLQEDFSDSLNRQFANLSQFNDTSCPFETSVMMQEVMSDLLAVTAINIQKEPSYRLPFIANCSVFFDSKIDQIICDTEFVNVQTLLSYEGNMPLPATEASFLHKGNILKTSMVVGLEPLQHPQVLYWLYFKLSSTQTGSQTDSLAITTSSSFTITDSNSDSRSTSAMHSKTPSITIHKSETLTKSTTTSLDYESQSLSKLSTASETNTIMSSVSTSSSKTGTSSLTFSQSPTQLPLQNATIWSSSAYADATNQTGRYVIVNPGVNATVEDTLTGLIWEQTVNGTSLTWNASAPAGSAQGYCAALTKGDYTDWRVPNIVELQSLVDYTIGNPSITINATAFPGTPSNYFWTSLSSNPNPSYAWDIEFNDRGAVSYDGTIGSTDYPVRCVRGNNYNPTIRYTDELGNLLNGGSTQVKDQVTGLIWQRAQGPLGSAYNWSAAQIYCSAALTLGSQTWRLPTVKELTTIVDYAVNYPSINGTAFPSTISNWFWSSTPVAGVASSAWFVYFYLGSVYNDVLNAGAYHPCVRCVRDVTMVCDVLPISMNQWAISAFADATNQTGRYFIPKTCGIVQDTFTGLVWEQTVNGTSFTWNASSPVGSAQNYCATLRKGGYTDWRVPNIVELQSLVDYTIGNPGITINTTAFPNTPSNYFWTSLSSVFPSTGAWDIRFNNGEMEPDGTIGSTSYPVRCVRGSGHNPTIRYTDELGNPLNGTGTQVNDQVTGLIWERTQAPSTYNWTAAQSYCGTTLTLGSKIWRLPTVKELTTIVDYTVYNPSINGTVFPSTTASYFWSSTSGADVAGFAWFVSFSDAHVNDGVETVYNYVRCVRDITMSSLNINIWSSFAYVDATNQTGRYVIANPGVNATVQDTLTGLVWEQTVNGTSVTWNVSAPASSAQGYCSNLTKGGYTDWRVPNVVELQSLVDYTLGNPGVPINIGAFPSPLSGHFWASSIYVASQTNSWNIYFINSGVTGYVTTQTAITSNVVRCVRGTQYNISTRFTDENDATLTGGSTQVKDQVTRLIWQRSQAPSTYNWTSAQSYCNITLTLGSQSWRLPTVKELTTIVDYTVYNPSINGTAFPSTTVSYFWSSTPVAGVAGYAWFVGFYGGFLLNVGVTNGYYVRCVR